jgi:hypothetical protein
MMSNRYHIASIIGLLCCFVVSESSLAGGSIGWEDVRARIAKDDPAFLAWVEQHFDIRHSGGAVRVGHQASGEPSVEGAQIGDRLPPFEFPAKPKNIAGDYTLYLIFDYSDKRQDSKQLWQVTIRRRLQSD